MKSTGRLIQVFRNRIPSPLSSKEDHDQPCQIVDSFVRSSEFESDTSARRKGPSDLSRGRPAEIEFLESRQLLTASVVTASSAAMEAAHTVSVTPVNHAPVGTPNTATQELMINTSTDVNADQVGKWFYGTAAACRRKRQFKQFPGLVPVIPDDSWRLGHQTSLVSTLVIEVSRPSHRADESPA